MTPLRIAVFGCGHLGRIHTRLIRNHADCELVGVYDPLESSRNALAAEFQTTAWSDSNALSGQIDAAIVATPTQYHRAVAADLLRRGIHCLVEKPITTTLDEADELINLAARQRSVLQVGHVERFNPAWQAVRSCLDRPRMIQATRASGYTFRSTDVGVVLDLMIHDLDLVLSLMTADLVQVDAWGQVVVGPHEDVANARLSFADGCVAQLTASRVSLQPQRTMQVLGETSHVWLDLAAGAARRARVSPRLASGRFDPNSLPADEKLRLRDQFFTELFPVEDVAVTPGNAIEDEQRDFVRAIREGGTPQVDGHAGRRALAVGDARWSQDLSRSAACPFLGHFDR